LCMNVVCVQILKKTGIFVNSPSFRFPQLLFSIFLFLDEEEVVFGFFDSIAVLPRGNLDALCPLAFPFWAVPCVLFDRHPFPDFLESLFCCFFFIPPSPLPLKTVSPVQSRSRFWIFFPISGKFEFYSFSLFFRVLPFPLEAGSRRLRLALEPLQRTNQVHLSLRWVVSLCILLFLLLRFSPETYVASAPTSSLFVYQSILSRSDPG